MATHDVTQLLSSVGSPLVDIPGEVVQKKLPASAVVQLLDAQIETLETKTQSKPALETVTSCTTAEDFVTDELHEALKAYSNATARYTHSSRVAAVVSDVTRALRHVVALQQAMEKSDTENVATLRITAERELAKIGIQANFQQGLVTLDTEEPLARLASMDLLVSQCKSMANQFANEESENSAFLLDIEVAEGGIRWTTGLADHPGHSKQVPGTETQVIQLSRQLLEQVVEPLLNSMTQWKATQTNKGLILEKTTSAASLKVGAAVPELKAVLSTLEPFIPERPDLRASLLRRCIPPIIELVKTHLTLCLPAVTSFDEVQESKAMLVAGAMELHRHLVQLRFVSDVALPRTKPPTGAPEPLSDLPAWTKTADAICKQHMVGAVLDHVRSIIVDTHDRLWDPVSKQVPVPTTMRVPLQPTTEKPSSIVAEKPPPNSTMPQAPISTPKNPLTKGKKPTLGVVKIGAKFPSTTEKALPPTVAPKNEKPEDDWEWGDEDEELAPQNNSTLREKEDLDDDWGWGDDDAEVEQILSETIEPPSTQYSQQAGSASVEEKSLDAWDWNEDDTEGEPEPKMPYKPDISATLHPPASAVQPISHLWQTYSVSKRIIEIHELIAIQWRRLDEDMQMRPWTAQGLVESVQLYRALMPIVHGQVLQHVPLLGMLFVNDCAFTAVTLREYATRSNKWGAFRMSSRQMLEGSLRAEADLLDDMSTQWRTALLAFQAQSLHECMDQADGFSRTDDNARYEACERAILQVQHLLTHLASVWRPVMAAETLVQVMCELVDGLFSRIMHEIEDLQDISEPESMRLAKLCHMLLEAVTSVLDGAETQVPSYFKFAYLPDILQGSMADLEYLLFGNESGSALCDYTREEMVMLVRALFADTPNRRRLLDGIQRWNSGSHV
ncbi:Uncharacterized protein MSYG_0585 [Malassezia sympodialis ATCC 42132]|uniref:ZW10 C-terminal helical domain-containing protein n=1 Tax=Malassezia sympodialis (strain ATCC 42132) TaxID=1230383 RepID=A0A1M8A1M0_MALS4|nr:Uncharacterized protein MSYG_0585 [Malassezia sympodialis ATCC 42132]